MKSIKNIFSIFIKINLYICWRNNLKKKIENMKSEKSNVEKFYEWMQRINSIHLANTAAMAAAFQKIVTQKL